jgi:hypothetical protein
MKKSDWLAEGPALGKRGSDAAFEIGQWIVRGEKAFLIEEPKGHNKKEWRAYWGIWRAGFNSLISEASKATNLAEKTLRQYALVVRRNAIVDGLEFAHHQEVMRCRYNNVQGDHTKAKLRFDRAEALEILMLAKENKWKVAETRAEVSRRYPRPTTLTVEDAVFTIRHTFAKVFDKVPIEQRLELIEALRTELVGMENAIRNPFDPDSVSEQDSMPF